MPTAAPFFSRRRMSPRLPYLVSDGDGLRLIELFADPALHSVKEACMPKKIGFRDALWSLAEFAAWVVAVFFLLLCLAVIPSW